MTNGFVHIELSTDDAAGARRFYKKIFDWKVTGVPGMGYDMIDTGNKGAGGGLTKKMMPDQPTAWLPYVEVASVKKTIAKAQKLGAQIVVPFQAVGTMGAIGIFVDPTGAALGIWEKTKKAAPKKKTAKKKTKRKA